MRKIFFTTKAQRQEAKIMNDELKIMKEILPL